MAPDSKQVKKYEAGKTNIIKIIKGKTISFSVLNKPNMHSVCLRRRFWGLCLQFCFRFCVFILLSRESGQGATPMTNPQDSTRVEVIIFCD